MASWKRSVLAILLLTAASASVEASADTPAADAWPVGLAAVDITPTYAVRLSGFGFRRTESEGVTQRIWAKALALGSDPDGPCILITTDNLGVPAYLVEELAARLARKAGIRRERLAVSATHTHTAPMLKNACPTLFGVPIPPDHQERIDRYTTEFLDRLEEVALKALADRKPAKLSWGIGQADFAANRRTAGGPVDHDLPILVVRDLQNKPRGILVSYACHCVTLSNNRISGDWAGYAQQAIQDDHPGAVALVAIGCGADANPSSGVTGDRTEVAAQQGRQIAEEVKRLLAGFLAPLRTPPKAAWKSIKLPLDRLPSREDWQERAKRNDAMGYHARVQLARLDRGEALRSEIDYPLQAWTFGDELAMVFMPGEVVVDYSLRLKRELDGRRLWINAYSNDAPCYIPSERILREGGYEGAGAMIYYDVPTRFKPGLEQPIIDAVKQLVGPGFKPSMDVNRLQGTRPLSPQQSAGQLRTRPNLAIELVAAEPLVHSPVAVDWGPDGRMYVAEMLDYPEGEAGDYRPGGRISVLVDTDRDGRYDRSHVLLAGIPFPTGVLAYRKGVLICAAPDILYAEDTNGDGRADCVKKLFSGFGTHNYQARVNSLEYGLDGWIYGSCGLFGGNIACRALDGTDKGTVALGDRDFRIRPETGEIEPATGRTQQGRVRDDWGNWFGCDNSTLLRHYPLEDHLLRRNPYVAPPQSGVYVPAYPNSERLFPINPRAQLFALSGPAGHVTAACGLGIYRDNLLGDEYRGNAFICEPVSLAVHREILTPRDSSFASKRGQDEKDREFLASNDPWFRPVQARTGPDGALWIVDMYRFVIEHPRWIPPADLARLDVRAGHDLGRIYRIYPTDRKPRPTSRLDNLTPLELVAAIATPNGWQRDLAAAMLVEKLTPESGWNEKERTSVLSSLKALVSGRPELPGQVAVEARLTALCVLGQVGCEGLEQLLAKASEDDAAPLRRHALRIARERGCLQVLKHNPQEDDPQVLMERAYALGAPSMPESASSLSELLIRHAKDPYLTAAALSSLNKHNAAAVMQALAPHAGKGPAHAQAVKQVVRTAAAVSDREQLTKALLGLLKANGQQEQPWQWIVLEGILAASSSEVANGPGELASTLREMSAAARRIATDDKAELARRIQAVRLLGQIESTRQADLETLGQLLGPQQPKELQLAALAALPRIPDQQVPKLILAGWKGHTPSLKAAMLDVLMSRTSWQKDLLNAVAHKLIPQSDIDPTRRQQLLSLSDESLRSEAMKLFNAATSPDRAKVIEQFAQVLTLSGNAAQGKQVFAKQCASCHRLENVGHGVGPDLAAVAGKSPGYLLQEILDPNKNVDSRYTDYRALTRDGQTLTGLLAGENATSLVLRGPEGKEQVILRTEIEELQSTGRSLMPEGLEKDLKPQDLADLIAYLTAAGPPPKQLPGNKPEVITREGRALKLLATNGAIYGADITLEPGFWNIGYWHGIQDRVTWTVQLEQPAEFDVWFDLACDPQSAGNECVLEGAEPVLHFKVPSTGAWSQYQWANAGSVRLKAGPSRITLRPSQAALRGALMDLRGIHLVPRGEKPAGEPKADPKRIASQLLDDSIPPATRQGLIQAHLDLAPELVAAMTADLQDDAREEYRRIPWIWRVAIAAGKRNDADQLRRLLEVSLPKSNDALRHWHAVVVGGGVINGISLQGGWPTNRMNEILKGRPELMQRWQRCMTLSSTMADDEKVPSGTRYDALRIIALEGWDKRGRQLAGYLKKGVHDELQMGAISGLGDIDSAEVIEPLLAGLPHFSNENRRLALDALSRNRVRVAALLDAIEKGKLDRSWLTPEQVNRLKEWKDEDLRARADRLFPK